MPGPAFQLSFFVDHVNHVDVVDEKKIELELLLKNINRFLVAPSIPKNSQEKWG